MHPAQGKSGSSRCQSHSAPCNAAHQSFIAAVVAGSEVEVTCLARKIHDILPNVQQFALPPSSPITLRVRYVESEAVVSHSRQCDERLCVAAPLRVSVP